MNGYGRQNERSEYKSEYKYIPDVRLIMRSGGYEADLIKILEEPVYVPFIPEIFTYVKGDINGRRGMNTAAPEKH